MITSRRVLTSAAVALSLALHLAVLYLFTDIRVGALAIPAEQRRLMPPLHLKRVEIPAATVDQPAPAPIAPPRPSLDAAPARLPEATQLTQALQGAPPRVDAPEAVPGSPPGFAPIVPAPPAAVSPYALNDRAKIEAAISQFAVGPTTPGLVSASPSLPAAPGANLAVGNEVAGQNGAGDAPSASALPSLSQVTAQFRTPPPTLNPNLPQPVVLALPTDVLFDFDSAILRPGAEGSLAKALAYIRNYPRADIEVDGHTDSFGTADYNQKLSLDRARTVQDWLRQRLADGAFSIQARGFGNTRPVVSTSGTVAEQQKNRRVEIVLRAIAPSSG